MAQPKYIRADVYEEVLTEHNCKNYRETCTVREFLKLIKDAPAEDVVPATKGQWKYKADKGYVCTICGNSRIEKSPFCPECGAMMNYGEATATGSGNAQSPK